MALTTEFWPEAPHGHVVQFYDHDHELAAGVGPYLAETIRAGGVAIVIATEAHRQAFTAWLAATNVNPELTEAGLGLLTEADLTPPGAALIMLDAREAADSLLIDGRLAPHRFDKLIGDLVREAVAGGRPVRAYGEIVALLWADGHVSAALELEELWNRLGREVNFSLYCAYPRSWVEAEVDAFHQVCRQHSAVVAPPVALQPQQTLSFVEATFRWSGRSPGQARRFVTGTLAAWGCGDLVDDAALIVTELATNAILHARTGFTVVLTRRPEGTIRVAVRDTSQIRPQPRRAGPLEGSGRGLGLVEALSTAWGPELLSDGKVVWAELRSASSDEPLPGDAALTAR
ncbi:MAG: MEDS domain-containing protein [Acidimicrobiia bacterium]